MKAKKPAKSIKPKPILGRPTSYDPKYCDMLIEHMQSGLSFESFAAVAGVNADTLYEWAKTQPIFSEAKKRAYANNLLFWENAGIKGMRSDKETTFNSTVWVFNMKNRHKWRDRQPDEVDTKIIVNPLKEQLKSLSTKELLKLAKEVKG